MRARAALLVVLAGCEDPAGVDGGNTDVEVVPDQTPATNSDELFSPRHLPNFEITIGTAEMSALRADPYEWVSARFEYGDVVFEQVGVRLKGNHSFQPIDEKPSFKIRFDEFDPAARLFELTDLTLNAMVVDSSMLREWASFRVFRELGVPAPRAGYARVWVNGEPYGLYLNLEPYNEAFAARSYADGTGNLYEAENTADVNGDVDKWDQDAGADLSRADLELLAELVKREDDTAFYGAEAVIDVPRFVDFMAGETFVAHFDGHVAGHNFFVYHEPSADLWTYLPWGLDQSFARRVDPFVHDGFLADKCLHDERCVVDYVLRSQDALARLGAVDWEAEIADVVTLTEFAVRTDARKGYSVESVEKGRAGVQDFIAQQLVDLPPKLDCLVDGVQPDGDGDGFGPCFLDCNDADPAINAGAEEICDGVDNNCSGYVDDIPACECPSFVSQGRTFYFCPYRIDWLDALEFCEAQGRFLARFADMTEVEEVWTAAQATLDERWSIGLNDREVENDYRWGDGSAPTFSAWAEGEPAHRLDWFDCAFLAGPQWIELNCIEQAPFICTDD